MNLTDDAYKKAIKVVEKCARPKGFFASGLPGGYEATWARDSAVTALGAGLLGPKFKSTVAESLAVLSKNQSRLGQIPNAVGDFNRDRQSDVTFNTVDSSLWYLIGHKVYAAAYRDRSLLKKYQDNIRRAFLWLAYQDPNEVRLITQLPTNDWQDAFPHKYGHAIYAQALYYAALKMYGQNEHAAYVKKIVNGQGPAYLALFDRSRGYYLPWIWKNHDGDREHEEWFDTFGNLAAIVFGLASPAIADKVLAALKKLKIDRPFPCKCQFPPLKKGEPGWQSYFEKCASKTPYQYSNAGIWPFLGGWYVAALVKVGKIKEAQKALERLAQANKLGKEGPWEFNEWLDGISGKPEGTPFQGWSAGCYIFAYEAVKRRKVPFF
jgi:glycogen debranching enzyme